MSRGAWYAAGQALRQPPRSGFEDEACDEYSSRASRYCNLRECKTIPLTVPFSHGPELLRALRLASGTTEMRPGSDLTAKVSRFVNEAHRGTGAYDLRLWGDTAAVARLCS